MPLLRRPLPFPPALLLALALSWAPAARADEADQIRALITRGDLAAALQRAVSALADRPRDAPLRFLQAVVLMDLQRNDEALTLFTELSQEYPELPDPYNNIALLHVRGGRLEPALQALQAALRNDPAHRIARANLGLVHLLLAARAWEQLAASGSPDPSTARRLEAVRALLAETPGAAR
jgi:Flp pilus assembly protein TadD